MLLSTPTHADADFYAGKSIELVIPTGPGGGFALYAQLVSEYLPRHINGSPEIRQNFLPGAGGMRAANYVAEIAARDGTILFMVNPSGPSAQMLFPDQARFDIALFEPVGVLSALNAVLVVRNDLGIETIEDAIGKEVIIGSIGRGSYTYSVSALLNELYGTAFNIVPTYNGTGEIMLAFERGEIGAFMSVYSSLATRHPTWLDGTGVGRVILQLGLEKESAVLDVPLLTELARTEEETATYRFVSHANAIARSLMMPPGTPQQRVAEMQAAFESMMQDPDFQHEAARLGLPVNWSGADVLAASITEVLATPEAVLAQVRSLTDEQ
jgi:tripartite-type tricarboxylate transporter receptor subunit TctC